MTKLVSSVIIVITVISLFLLFQVTSHLSTAYAHLTKQSNLDDGGGSSTTSPLHVFAVPPSSGFKVL